MNSIISASRIFTPIDQYNNFRVPERKKFLIGKVDCFGFTADNVNQYVTIDRSLSIKENFENNHLIESIRDDSGIYFRNDFID